MQEEGEAQARVGAVAVVAACRGEGEEDGSSYSRGCWTLPCCHTWASARDPSAAFP